MVVTACCNWRQAAMAAHSLQPPNPSSPPRCFCCRGQGGFCVEDGKVVRAAPQLQEQPSAKKKKKKKSKQQPPLVAAEPVPSPVAAATSHSAEKEKKKAKKKRKGEQLIEAVEGEQQVQPAAAADAAGTGAAAKKKKKKSKKRRAAAEAEQAWPERGQQHAEPPAAAEQQQQEEPAAKRQKQRAGGSGGPTGNGGVWAALAAAEPTPRSTGALTASASPADNEQEDVTEVRWRDNEKRQNVKSGAYSKAEKATLRQAGACWGCQLAAPWRRTRGLRLFCGCTAVG